MPGRSAAEECLRAVAQSKRHEAAVVSIDVVGYSAMMAADPDGTVETLAIAHGHVVAPGIDKLPSALIF